MKNFQTVVQELLHNHERQRRYIALLTALCMLMAFTVSIILIEPAESMTGELACGMTEHIHNENCFTYTCGLEDDASHVHSADCRKLICEKTEHAHSENCYIHEDEQTAQIMQINSPQFIDNADSGSPGGSTRTTYYFSEVQREKPANANEFPEIKSMEVTVGGITYKCPSEEGNKTIEIPGGAGDFLEGVKFHIDYLLTSTSVTKENPYIYYQLPAGVKIPEDLFGDTRQVIDDEYKDGSGVAGYYSISKEGLIVIRFTDDYIDKRISESTDKLKGFIEFNSSIERNSDASGDRTLEFQNEHTFNVTFDDRDSYNLQKNGEIINGTDLEVKWTISARTYSSSESLSGFEVHDEKFKNAKDNSITVDPPNLGDWVNDEAGTHLYYKFNDGMSSEVNSVTFTFYETIDRSTLKDGESNPVTNTAELKKGGTDITAEDTVNFDQKPTLTKNGTADYSETNGSAEFKSNINWKIDVHHPYGKSLNGYSVSDRMFEGKSESDFTVKSGGEDVSFTLENGKITFNSETSGDVTITYKSAVVFDETSKDTATVTNNANLLYPDGNKVDGSDVQKTVTYKVPQELKPKTGTYDHINGEITWEVGAQIKDNSYKNVNLDGYVMQDDAFKYLDFKNKDFTIKAFNWTYDWGHNEELKITSQSDTVITFDNGATITLDKTTGKIKVEGDIREFTITYETDPKNSGSDGTRKEEDKVYNDVSDNWGHTSGVPDGVDVSQRDITTKRLVSKNGFDNEYLNKDANVEGTLSWEVIVNKDAGFGADALTDTVEVQLLGSDAGESVNYKHYIDKSSIKIYGSIDGTSYVDTPIDSSNYTISVQEGNTEEPTKISISFTNTSAVEGLHFIKVTYDSKVKITGKDGTIDFGTDHTINFKFLNTANGTKAESDYTIRENDYIEKIPLTVKKTWRAGNADETGDDKSPIRFRLERKEEGTNEWKTIWYDETGEKWEETTEDKSYELSYSVNSDESWTKKFENLPVTNPDHTKKYVYRVVELDSVDGYITTYNPTEYAPTGDKDEGNLGIINTKKGTLTKKAYDKDGKLIEGEVETSSLIRQPVDGVDCYIIKYEITEENHTGTLLVEDKLPTGFSLVHDSSWTWGSTPKTEYHPTYGSNYFLHKDNVSVPAKGESGNGDGNTGDYSYNEAERLVKFKYTSGQIIKYYISIPCSVVDAALTEDDSTFKVTNTATGNDGSEAEKEFDIKKGTEVPGAKVEDVLTKKISNTTITNGKVGYDVFINPEGKDLANGDYYDIIDILDITSLKLNDMYQAETDPEKILQKLLAGNIELTAKEITDVTRNADGSMSCREVGDADIQYNVEYLPVTYETKNLNVEWQKGFGDNYVNFWSDNNTALKNYSSKLKIKITGSPNETISFSDFGITEKKDFDVKLDENGFGYFYYETKTGFDNGNYYLPITFNYKEGSPHFTDIQVDSVTYEESTPHAARLTVTVPDGTPLKIHYSYTFTDENGSIQGADGTFHSCNVVSVDTGNVKDWKEENADIKMEYSSEAGIKANKIPKIIKYNVGNIGENLSAQFYVAEYTSEGWKFSNSAPTDYTNGDDIGKKFSFDSKPEKPEAIPSDAVAFTIPPEGFHMVMEEKKLYKIIEIKVPNGDYEANDEYIQELVAGDDDGIDSLEDLLKNYLSGKSLDSAYDNIINKFVYVHYFKLGNEAVEPTAPTDQNIDTVKTVQAGGTLGIPNNALVDISASKSWDTDVNGMSAEVELWWSNTKNLNVDDADFTTKATKATAENLGLQNFNGLVTLNSENSWTYNWENLPNGKDDRPIYYYIRETKYSYTENGETKAFKRDDTDGNFYQLQSETSKDFVEPKVPGDFHQVYTDNGTNKNNAKIKLKNTKGLYVRKVWLNADKEVETNVTQTSIDFRLYGTRTEGTSNIEELIYEGRLTNSDGWSKLITGETLLINKQLSDYTSFRVEETSTLYGYVIGYGYNLSGTTGEITITNRSNIPTNIQVEVDKVWGDGDALHGSDSVNVKLYRSTRELTTEELTTLSGGATVDDAELVNSDETIHLSNANSWKHTWDSLPYKAANSNDRYYYYPVEMSPIKEDYTATYSRNDKIDSQKITITNAKPRALSIVKQWQNSKGEIVNSLQDSIEVSVYKRLKNSSGGSTVDDAKTPDDLKVLVLGDSITQGTFNSLPESSRYWYQLRELLQKGGYKNATIVERGNDGDEISDVLARVNETGSSTKNVTVADVTDLDVACVLVGTNDLLHGKYNNPNTKPKGTDSIEEFKNLIQSLNNKAKGVGNDDLKILVGSIPDITLLGWFQYPNNGLNQVETDALVKELNNDIKKAVDDLQKKGIKVTFVPDINTNCTKDMLYDGCHPDKDGYREIAKAFYNAINTAYDVTTEYTVETDIDRIPDDFYKSPGVVDDSKYTHVDDVTLSASSGWTASIPNLDTGTDGNEYVYYIVEKTSSQGAWTVSYGHNGQTIGEMGSTITLTNTIETIDLNVEKQWNDNGQPHVDGTVQFKLHRTTDQSKIPTQSMTPDTLTTSDGKTEFNVSPDNPATFTIESDRELTVENDNEEIVEVIRSGNQFTIQPISGKTGTAIIKISDGFTTLTITINVTAEPVLELIVPQQIEIGKSTEMTVTLGTETISSGVKYSVTPTDAVSFSGNSVIGQKVGDATITAEYNGKTATAKLKVVYPEFTAPERITVEEGETVSLGLESDWLKDFVVAENDDSADCIEIITNADGSYSVKGNKAGKASITVSRDGNVTKTITVEVTGKTTPNPPSSDEPNLPKNYENVFQPNKPTIKEGYHVTKIVLQVESINGDKNDLYVMLGDYADSANCWNSNIRIPKDNNADISFGSSHDYFKEEDVKKVNQEDGTTIITVVPTGDKKIINMEIGEYGQYSLKYVITCQNDSGDTDYIVFPAESESSETENVRTFSPLAQISTLSEETQTGEWTSDTNGGEVYSETYEMKDSTNWKATISNLPVKDSAGNAYYYWIEEVAVSGYEASYRYVDGDDTQNKAISSVQLGTDPKITITNTKKESSTTTMPSTGGNGAKRYYTVGGMLMLLSACGWAMHRRKRVIPH